MSIRVAAAFGAACESDYDSALRICDRVGRVVAPRGTTSLCAAKRTGEDRAVRVVGGQLRSRRLVGPPEGVRPTSDRVREAVFGKLGDPDGARVLDLFAGTGALAIEALSRGAAFAVLVDRSAGSVRVIGRNLAALDLEDRTEVVRADALVALRRLAGGEPFDLVFLDPPYDSDRLPAALAALVESELLAEGATVVVERAKRHPVIPPAGLGVTAERDYGDTRVTWLSPHAPSETPLDRDGDQGRT